MKAALADQILILNDKIWTEKLRIDHGVIFQASAPRIFSAAALIALVAAEDLAAATALVAAGSAAIASVVAVDLAAIASAAAAAGSADSAVAVLADGEAAADGDDINVLNQALSFL